MDELSKDELIDTIGNLKRQLSAKSIALQAAYSFIHGQFPEFAYEDIPRCIEHPSLLRPSSTQKQMDRQSHILSEVLYAPRLSETSVIMCIAAMEKMGPYFFSAWKLRIVVLHKKGLEYWSPPVNDSPQGATFQNCMSSSMKEHIKSLTGTGWRVGLETLGCRRMVRTQFLFNVILFAQSRFCRGLFHWNQLYQQHVRSLKQGSCAVWMLELHHELSIFEPRLQKRGMNCSIT